MNLCIDHFLIHTLVYIVPVSSVNIVTKLWAGQAPAGSRDISLFNTTSRLTLGPTQLAVAWGPRCVEPQHMKLTVYFNLAQGSEYVEVIPL